MNTQILNTFCKLHATGVEMLDIAVAALPPTLAN